MDVQDAYLKNVQAEYRYYCYHVHNQAVVNGGGGELNWIPSKFHMYLCDTVQEFLERPNTRGSYEILIVSTPPQHGKSKTITATLPSWYLMRNPDKKTIVVSYGDDLAGRFGKQNLDKITEFSPLFNVKVDKKKAKASEIRLAGHEGVIISKGYGSGITGNAANLMIIDDPIKNREDADSANKRDKIWSEYLDTLSTRFSSDGKLIVIMTRWHEDDLAGRLIKEFSDRVQVVNLPCEAEENDPLGRKIGDALCPEIGKGNEWLKDFKRTYSSEEGVRSWNALYQGRPTSVEGNMLKREWWQYYDVADYENGKMKMDTVLISVDATFKDEAKNDYVAIEVWGKLKNRIYLIDLINKHLNFPDTLRAIQVMKLRYPEASPILIEDKANGSGLIQTLREEMMGVIGVNPVEGKESRVQHVSVAIEAGNVYLPRDKQFTWEFIEQCAAFPRGKHDDMVDAMSQSLSRLMHRREQRALQREMRKGDKYFHIQQKKKMSGYGKGDTIHVI